MAEACDQVGVEFPDRARLDALAGVAAMFPWPLGCERDDKVCHDAAYLVDAVLGQISDGRGALEVAIGEGLSALAIGDRTMDLGYSNIGDYAREELGINAGTAVKLARLARRLRDRPLLREAVRKGEVSARKAESIVRVAHGELEAYWVQRAKMEPVRELTAAAAEPPDPEEGRWTRICTLVPDGKRPVLDEALDVARKALGQPTAPTRELLLAISEEYLSAHPVSGEVGVGELSVLGPEDLGALEEWLERETTLAALPPVEAPAESFEFDPWHLDRLLKQQVATRDRWDESFGHLAMIFRAMRGWEPLGFASFPHYCRERLGMGERTVCQRASLELKLREVPVLRQALREKRLSYEKARLLARHLERQEIAGWIDRAQNLTCVELRRALEGKDEAQMCARGAFQAWLPGSTALVVAAAFHAARKTAGRSLSPGECLLAIAEHFIEVWKPIVAQRDTLQTRIRKRDRHLCQVRGCSRPAVHAHHIVPRSQCGSDHPSNLVSLCAAHHLRGIHGARMRVTGTAPDKLRWELVGRDGMAVPFS